MRDALIGTKSGRRLRSKRKLVKGNLRPYRRELKDFGISWNGEIFREARPGVATSVSFSAEDGVA